MKNKVVYALLFLLLELPVFSQVDIPLDSLTIVQKPFVGEWAFGINGGITMSKVSFNPLVKQNSLLQYSGGLTARYISEKNVGLQIELNYSLRGWNEKLDSVNLNQNTLFPNTELPDSIVYPKYCRSLSYIELPILTHIYFNMGSRARIIFLLGPQLGYNINEKVLNSYMIPKNQLSPHPYYDKKIQHAFDYGLLGGMGFELRTGIGSFVVDGRYYFGLADIFGSKKSDYFQASPNKIFNIKLSYLFRK